MTELLQLVFYPRVAGEGFFVFTRSLPASGEDSIRFLAAVKSLANWKVFHPGYRLEAYAPDSWPLASFLLRPPTHAL